MWSKGTVPKVLPRIPLFPFYLVPYRELNGIIPETDP
jgi:hypothetical protein